MTARTLQSYVAAGIVTVDEARVALGGKKKRSKYGAVRCELDGIKFDSLRERDRYCELKLREKAGEIRGLFVHPVYPVVINGRTVFRVELDFAYTEVATGKQRVEDVKGRDTPVSRIKRACFHAAYPHLKVEIVR